MTDHARDWFWIRHGPTHAKGMIGWTDLPADLSDTATLSRLAAALPQTATVVSSDLRRAVRTADAVAGTRRRLPNTPALREIHFGRWEKRAFADIEAEDPDRIFAFWDQPGDIAAPGGESWNTLRARVDSWVDSYDHPGPIVAVAHFGVILTQVQRAFGLTAREAFAHKIDNLSLTHLREAKGDWDALDVNRSL